MTSTVRKLLSQLLSARDSSFTFPDSSDTIPGDGESNVYSLPKPFVPYSSPTGSPSLFSPKSTSPLPFASRGGGAAPRVGNSTPTVADATTSPPSLIAPQHSTPSSASADFAFKVPLTPLCGASPLWKQSIIGAAKTPGKMSTTPLKGVVKSNSPASSFATTPKTLKTRVPASSSKAASPKLNHPPPPLPRTPRTPIDVVATPSYSNNRSCVRDSLCGPFVTPPNDFSGASPSPRGASVGVASRGTKKTESPMASVAPLDLDDGDGDLFDYKAVLTPAHDFDDNSDFWSDDDDELMRTALEDLSPKSRKSVRQSLHFLSKRPSIATFPSTLAASDRGPVNGASNDYNDADDDDDDVDYVGDSSEISTGSEDDIFDEESSSDKKLSKATENRDEKNEVEDSWTAENSVEENDTSATLLLARLQNLGSTPTASPDVVRFASPRTSSGQNEDRDDGDGDKAVGVDHDANCVIQSSQKVLRSRRPKSKTISRPNVDDSLELSSVEKSRQAKTEKSTSSVLPTAPPSPPSHPSTSYSSSPIALDVLTNRRKELNLKPLKEEKKASRFHGDDGRDDDDNDDDSYGQSDDDVILSSQKPVDVFRRRHLMASTSKKGLVFELEEEDDEVDDNEDNGDGDEEDEDLFENSFDSGGDAGKSEKEEVSVASSQTSDWKTPYLRGSKLRSIR